MVDEIKDWGWAVLLMLAIAYYALRDKLGLDFIRRRDFAPGDFATKTDLNGLGERVHKVETFAFGAHDKLGDIVRRQDGLEQRVEQIDKYGSAPMRELSETLAEIREDMREINTHLKYLRNQNGSSGK